MFKTVIACYLREHYHFVKTPILLPSYSYSSQFYFFTLHADNTKPIGLAVLLLLHKVENAHILIRFLDYK